jgi:hypothetical protein
MYACMGFSHGELTNFSNIAPECGVDSKTVKAYNSYHEIDYFCMICGMGRLSVRATL